MKKILLLVALTIISALLLGSLRVRERVFRKESLALLDRQTELAIVMGKAEAEQAALHRDIADQKTQRALIQQSNPLSPALVDWLLKGDFSQVPEPLTTELRSALALPQNLSPDFVLVSKTSLHSLEPASPDRNDKVPDTLAALLSLSPQQRQEVEASLSNARHEFSEWARQNVQRQGPQGDTLVTYTIPMATDSAETITNQLFAQLTSAIGPERTGLFCAYADTWFQIETGWLGGVTNTLSVMRRSGNDGQSALFYHLTREGPASSMGEGPGEIAPQFFPPAWRNVFPGGWPEVAQREGFELPVGKPSNGKP